MKPAKPRFPLLLFSLLAAQACSTSPAASSAAAATVDPPAERAHATIARLMDARSDGGGALYELARHSDPQVRASAMQALGRLPFPRFREAPSNVLRAGLSEPEPLVRSAAAFAIGMRADPALEDALLGAWHDAHELVRARVVEAAGKIATPRLCEAVLSALQDASLEVRIEAVVAPHRWPRASAEDAPGEPGSPAEAELDARVDAALIEVATEHPIVGGAVVDAANIVYGPDTESEDIEVVWRALFALQRRSSAAAREVFIAYSTFEESVLARLFAVKGLARIEPDERVVRALEHAIRDADWRVAVEALAGLGQATRSESLTPIEYALGAPSAHVRAAAYTALGELDDPRVPTLLERARVDRSATVRNHALVAEARVRGDEIAPDLEAKMIDPDPLVRAATAQAIAHLPSELAVPYLTRLASDRQVRVAGIAIEMLARHPTPEAHDALLRALEGRDNGLRLAAVLALRSNGRPADLPFLARAIRESRGDVGPEVRFNCLKNVAAIGGDDALEILRAGLEDPHPYVRQVARDALVEAGVEVATERGALLEPGEPVLARTPNPLVEISTNRGSMTFELFADEAPVHVENFLQLAAADHYDNLTFHRVAPDFVIQGGCYRGDGNGAKAWRGDALRHEIGPRKYVRGSLGMPRNEDWESGGSQFFVTHRPTPHLDGRYTIFGELRSGSRVLDAIEIGDVILDVRVLE